MPFIEIEDVFINKMMRSLQLKVRECIVYPPPERLSVRTSVCFPGRLCCANDAAAAAAGEAPPAAVDEPIVPAPVVAAPEPEPEPEAEAPVPATSPPVPEEQEEELALLPVAKRQKRKGNDL